MAITILNCVLLSPAIPLLGIYPQEVFVSVREEVCAKMSTGTLSINCWQQKQQLQCPVLSVEWQNKSRFVSSRGELLQIMRDLQMRLWEHVSDTQQSFHKAGAVQSYHIKQKQSHNPNKAMCLYWVLEPNLEKENQKECTANCSKIAIISGEGLD